MGSDQRIHNQSERVAFKYFTQRNHFLEKIKILYVMNSITFWVAKVQILTTQFPTMNMNSILNKRVIPIYKILTFSWVRSMFLKNLDLVTPLW